MAVASMTMEEALTFRDPADVMAKFLMRCARAGIDLRWSFTFEAGSTGFWQRISQVPHGGIGWRVDPASFYMRAIT